MQAPAVCNVRSQSAGCPTSPAIDFLVPGLEGHHFVAWGVDGGIIDVGFFQVPHASHDTSSPLVSVPSSWRHLISLNLGPTNDAEAEAVIHLAFGGGPHVLLAAATRTKLAVFSLEQLMDHVFQADTASGVGSELDSRPWELSPAVHDELYLVGSINCFRASVNNSSLKREIVSMAWTHQLDGILVSDTAGGLAMWQLKPIGFSSNTNNFVPASGGDVAVMTPSSATCASLRCAWTTTAPETQDLLSAGVSIDAPSASAASVGEKNANIWWPENSSSTISTTSGNTTAVGNSDNMSGSFSSSSTIVSVRREKLKHSCNITSLEWCPGVLRKDVFATTTTTDHLNTNISTNNVGNSSSLPPIEDHPALMTLGTDKAVRLWVEMLVVHHAPMAVQSSGNTGSKEQQQAPAPTLDSYFAMALVIDAPTTAAATRSGNAVGAVTPEKSSTDSIIQADFDAKTSNNNTSNSMIAHWVRGSGSLMGRQRRGTTSSEVLWLIIAVKMENEDDKVANWLVELYAVRGLSPVVVANVPGSVAGVSSLSGGAGSGKRPQAVLWGQHLWSGVDNSTTTMCLDSRNTLPFGVLSSFSAWMSAEDDFPVVTCFDIAARIARPLDHRPTQTTLSPLPCAVVDITAAGVTYATVLAENPTAPSTLHQRLDALSSWKAHTAGHMGTITAMALCPSNGNNNSGNIAQNSGGGSSRIVATVDEFGNIALWDAKNGIIEYLQSYTTSSDTSNTTTSSRDKISSKFCLEWIRLPSSTSASTSTTAIAASVSIGDLSTTTSVVAPSSYTLIVGAGQRLLALHTPPSSSSSTTFKTQLEIVGEVDGTILSLHELSSSNLLLVLYTTTTSDDAFQQHPTHASLFHMAQSTTFTLLSKSTNAIPLPSSLLLDSNSNSSRITSVFPIANNNNEEPAFFLLVGTTTGQVHTLRVPINPINGSGILNRIEEVSKPITLLSGSSSAVVALSVDGDSGTVAAVLSNNNNSGHASRVKTKSYLALWKLQHQTSPTTTTTTTTTMRPVCIPLENPGCSVSWLTDLIVPCVVVGDICGDITFYAPVRDATEGWKAVARVEAALTDGIFSNFGNTDGFGGDEKMNRAAAMAASTTAVHCLSGGINNINNTSNPSINNSSSVGVVAAVGSRLVCASNDVIVDHDELKPLSRHLVEVAGPLPQYHPRMLQALLLGGHRDTACAVLRALTTWAPQYLSYQEQQRYYRLYRTTSDTMAVIGNSGTIDGTGIGISTGGGDSGSIGEAPTPRAAAELEAAGPPPFPAVALEHFLKAGVVNIPAKLAEMVEKMKEFDSGKGNNASVQGVATKLSDLGISSAKNNNSGGTSSASTIVPPAASAVDMMASGQLDMSAFMMGGDSFGGGFGGAVEASATPLPPPPPPATTLSSSSAMDTGMLDLAAFGMDMMPPPPEPVVSQPPVIPAPTVPSIHGATTTAGKEYASVLAAPKQASIPISELHPFSSELLHSLHQIVGLVASNEDTPGQDQEERSGYSNCRDLSFLRGTSTTATTGALDLLRSRPLQPLPGLTLEETQEVVALATYFSSEGSAGGGGGNHIDEAGAYFLTALNLACSRPFEDPSNVPFTHDYNHNLSQSRGGSSSSTALASAASTKNLHKTASSASTAALLKRSKSVRNAAGVEYTLAPSMSSRASFSSAFGDEDDEEDEASFERGNGVVDVLTRRWGLAPNLQPSALLWAQLTTSPQALLDHALSKIAARDAEISAFVLAEAVAQYASAADFVSKPSVGFGSNSSGGSSGPTWPALRAVGVGFWLHDRALLASTAESLAKSRFAAKRNPDDTALFYTALGKKTVLQGLYRTTNQTRQADFLGRDFSQVKHQQAACKNAFVLMGNHRPELAAAFFILGASPGDAVSVCVRELGDVQLALFIARLLHGPGSEAERALIERHILPAVLAAGAAAGGSQAGDTTSGSVGGWASATTAWLLGDSSACLKSILGLPAWPSSSLSNDVSPALRDGPEGLVQLLPAVELASQLTPTPSSSELQEVEMLKEALLERCATASEALQSAGLPALALQFEAVAAACTSSTTQQRESNSNTSGSRHGQGLRAAWACAAALLSHPSGTMQASAIEKQLAALRAMGLDIDKIEALKRIHTLQKAINPTTSAAAGAGSGGFSSLLSPRVGGGGPSSLFRQGSFDTNRSTHSMHSSGSGGPRLSLDGRYSKQKATPTLAGHGTSSGHHQKPLPLSEGSIIFQVDSDSLHGVACCPLISPQVLGRPIVTATHRHGLLEFAAQAPPLQRHSSATLDSVPDHHEHDYTGSSPLLLSMQNTEDAHDLISEGSLPVSPHSPSAAGGENEQSANMFSRFLSQIFDQSSWTLDPMERTHSAIDGDIGLVVGASSGPLSPKAHTAGSPQNNSTSPSSTSERYSFSTSINPQNTRALTLAAHSSRQLFLSGCETSGRVQLWQFGGPRPVASFTPVSPKDLIATQADTGLLSFSFATRATARSNSLVGRLGHWGGARGLAFSPNGERFAAVGDGGVVATWRLGGGAHRPTDVDGALCAEWWHHCLSKEGRAVVYIGGGGSVVAVGGKCSSGNIALWDAASPPAEACIGRLKHHSATVNALCTMPGGWLLTAADAGGALSLTDIRMLGGSTGGARTLWSVRASKGAVQSLVMLPLAAVDRPRALAMGAASGGSGVLVSGGQDGIVRVWQASSGKLLQSLEGSNTSSTSSGTGGKISGVLGGGKGLLGSLGGGGSSGSSHSQGVTGLAVCEEGVVSCGADGTVRLFPLAHAG